MITKSDWQAVHHEMAADDRRKSDEPPTAEQLLAYSDGALSADEAERVRLWLASDPQLARAVMEPFPQDDPKPGDPDFLSRAELAEQWNKLQQRIHGAQAPLASRVVRFPSPWLGVAAVMALVFAGLYWQSQSEVRQLRRELGAPQVLQDVQELYPDRTPRGGGTSPPVVAAGESAVLDLSLDAPQLQRYQVIVNDLESNSRQWGPHEAQRRADGYLSIYLPGAFLRPGTYQVVVHGAEGTREEQDTFTFRVGPR
jgi:hypothetical protein